MSRRQCKGTSKCRRGRGHVKQLWLRKATATAFVAFIYTWARDQRTRGSQCLWLHPPWPETHLSASNVISRPCGLRSIPFGRSSLLKCRFKVGTRVSFTTEHNTSGKPRGLIPLGKDGGVRFHRVCGPDQIRVSPGTRQHGSCLVPPTGTPLSSGHPGGCCAPGHATLPPHLSSSVCLTREHWTSPGKASFLLVPCHLPGLLT